MIDKDNRVIATTKNGSTTIKHMLIDGHEYVFVFEDGHVVSRRHKRSSCKKCIQARIDSGISVMLDGVEHTFGTIQDQIEYKRFKKEWDTSIVLRNTYSGMTPIDAFYAHKKNTTPELSAIKGIFTTITNLFKK